MNFKLPINHYQPAIMSRTDENLFLSTREIEILHHFNDGLTYEQTGDKLGISPETVRKHATNIYKRLEVKNRTQALNKFLGGRNNNGHNNNHTT